jgi:DNA ligase-1
MNSTEIFNCLQLIANTISKNEKVKLIYELLGDDDFKEVIVHAYNPYMMFGIKTLPPIQPGIGVFNKWTWQMLLMLNRRDLTGDDARVAVLDELGRLDYESGLLLRYILNKDLRIGANAKLINKAYQGLIPVVPYMRCSLPKDIDISKFDWKYGCFSQEKLDGMFINVSMPKGNLKIHTRLGQPMDISLVPQLERHLTAELDSDYQYHGELEVYLRGKLLERKIANGVINSVMKGAALDERYELIPTFWDYIPLDVTYTRIYVKAYWERFGFLQKKWRKLRLAPTRIVHSIEEAEEHFLEVRAAGGEGTIVKDPHGIWKDHTSPSMFKMKDTKTIDLKVIGFTEGNGKFSDSFGALMCESEDGKIAVNVSGMTDAERQLIHENREDWLYGIVEVYYNALIQDRRGNYSLYLPRYGMRRFDKSIADTLERAL